MDWKALLAYITGSVDEQLILRNAYLVAEKDLLRHQCKGRLQLSDAARQTLTEIGKKLGQQVLEEVAKVAKSDTILGWHRTLVAQKCDGSTQRKSLVAPASTRSGFVARIDRKQQWSLEPRFHLTI